MKKEQKPCAFCEDEQFISKEFGQNGIIQAEFYPDNGCLAFYAAFSDDYGLQEENISIDVNYCPVCGRKIGLY